MVAARDIKVGENIFKEAPLTFGPSENTKPICLGCYKSVSMTSPRCSACGFPMCSKDCPDIKFHKKFECAAFVKHNFKVNADLIDYESRTEPVYEAISAIRTFLVQKLNPEIWPLIWMQMSHLSQRNSSEFWKKGSINCTISNSIKFYYKTNFLFLLGNIEIIIFGYYILDASVMHK